MVLLMVRGFGHDLPPVDPGVVQTRGHVSDLVPLGTPLHLRSGDGDDMPQLAVQPVHPVSGRAGVTCPGGWLL
jgi:hypothetical protein